MMMMVSKMPIVRFIIFVWDLLKVLQNEKLNLKKVKLEKDDLIAKSDETNNLNKNFKNKISS